MAASKKPAKTRSRRLSKRQKEELMVLALFCPYTDSNPPECPLYEVRKLNMAGIAAWFDGLAPEDKEYLLLYHRCCLAIKTGTAGGELAELPKSKCSVQPVAPQSRKPRRARPPGNA